MKIFKSFGTAMINFNGENYEFIGARKESYRTNSRKPAVEDGTLDDDQKEETLLLMQCQSNLTKKTLDY